MPNNIFRMLNPQQSFMSDLKSLQSNPFQFLMQKKLNIPEGMNDPQQIVQHWLDNGTMSQEQFNSLQSKVSQIMGTH